MKESDNVYSEAIVIEIINGLVVNEFKIYLSSLNYCNLSNHVDFQFSLVSVAIINWDL